MQKVPSWLMCLSGQAVGQRVGEAASCTVIEPEPLLIVTLTGPKGFPEGKAVTDAASAFPTCTTVAH